jgi:GDP-L-fucose synthase
MKPNSKIYVAGHNGLLGSAIMRRLTAAGYKNTIGLSHDHLDLCETRDVFRFFHRERPEYVFLAAARVGGVCSNDGKEAEFLAQNLQIQMNVIEGAHRHGAKKLLFMGSACVYPRDAAQPVREDSLLTGPLEPSNEWYALAKIAGLKLCQAYRKQHGSDFISCMPTNLYGPGDKYDLTSSHVLPALIRKFHEAKMKGNNVVCWGTGSPTREFLYSDDCADACITLMKYYNATAPVNIGGCNALTISGLAVRIAAAVGFSGDIEWDKSKPDGTPRRALDGSKMAALGWSPKIGLSEGLRRTYRDFLYTGLTPHSKQIYDSMR